MNERTQLFDNINRTDSDPSGYSESRFVYLNRTARSGYDYIREILQQWYDDFEGTSTKREKMRKDFRSETDHEHLDAFFELYLNNFFKASGFNVQVEPPKDGQNPLWSRNDPDFLLTADSGEKLLVEAASVYPPHEFGGDKQRFQELLDAISKDFYSPDYWVNVALKASTSERPPLGKILKHLEGKLAELSYEQVKEQF